MHRLTRLADRKFQQGKRLQAVSLLILQKLLTPTPAMGFLLGAIVAMFMAPLVVVQMGDRPFLVRVGPVMGHDTEPTEQGLDVGFPGHSPLHSNPRTMGEMAKYKVRWRVPQIRGDKWQYSPTEHTDLEKAKDDARDVAGYEGIGPVEVFREEGDAGIVEWKTNWSA